VVQVVQVWLAVAVVMELLAVLAVKDYLQVER
jgi:hypothetical protein